MLVVKINGNIWQLFLVMINVMYVVDISFESNIVFGGWK